MKYKRNYEPFPLGPCEHIYIRIKIKSISLTTYVNEHLQTKKNPPNLLIAVPVQSHTQVKSLTPAHLQLSYIEQSKRSVLTLEHLIMVTNNLFKRD